MIRRLRTDRIGLARIARQCQRLTAAASEIDLFAVATLARFRQPAGSAIGIKGSTVIPDVTQGTVLHPLKAQMFQRRRRMAGQNGAVRRDIQTR